MLAFVIILIDIWLVFITNRILFPFIDGMLSVTSLEIFTDVLQIYLNNIEVIKCY